MSGPLVSICCITYNHEKYIRQTLEGFIMQNTEFPYEVLINDDASTDNTADIIREYEKKYPDIIKPTYQNENQFSKGTSIFATSTFPRIKGKYVALCEGDDYWTDPLKLQKQVDFLDAHPECSICFHPVKVIYVDGSKPDDVFPSAKVRFNKTVLAVTDLVQHNFIQTNSVMYRWMLSGKNISEVFPNDILPIDWYLHLLHAEKGSIGFIDEVMSVYRRHSGGIWWEASNNIIEHHKKYGFKELKFCLCLDKHFNYQYTESFTKLASKIASYMVVAFNKDRDYAQIKRLQDEYEKYYRNGITINRLIFVKNIILAPKRYLRKKVRLLFFQK